MNWDHENIKFILVQYFGRVRFSDIDITYLRHDKDSKRVTVAGRLVFKGRGPCIEFKITESEDGFNAAFPYRRHFQMVESDKDATRWQNPI